MGEPPGASLIDASLVDAGSMGSAPVRAAARARAAGDADY